MLICSPDRPWGIHSKVRSDGDCPRCGWTAPGPKGDALEAAEQARAWMAEMGWPGNAGEADRSLARRLTAQFVRPPLNAGEDRAI